MLAHKLQNVHTERNSPLKRGLGGFSELTFEVGKSFDHES